MTTNLLVIAAQIIVQTVNQELFNNIGFPFQFFYYNEPHGLHGLNILHLLYDGLITIVLVTLGILIYKKIYGKKSNTIRSREVLDSE